MPVPSPARSHARLSRRVVLSGLAAAAAMPLVGCTTGASDREDGPGPVEPEVDPDVVIATESLTAQQATIALVLATQQRHPGLAARLAPLLTAHQAHADLLAEAVPDGTVPPQEPASGDATTDPAVSSAGPSPSPEPTVPGTPQRALRALAGAERELVTLTKQHAFKARSGAFARVLGSVAAAAAQHAAVLGESGGRA